MKVETYIIKGWKNDISGVTIDENKEWVLLHELSSDYHLDGYTLLRKDFILGRASGKWEKQVKLVQKLRKYSGKKPKGFKFADMETMLDKIVVKSGLFSFQDDVENALQIGLIERFSKKNIFIRFIKANGKIDKKYLSKYKMSEIRKISFETDYLEGLKLLFTHRNK